MWLVVCVCVCLHGIPSSDKAKETRLIHCYSSQVREILVGVAVIKEEGIERTVVVKSPVPYIFDLFLLRGGTSKWCMGGVV